MDKHNASCEVGTAFTYYSEGKLQVSALHNNFPSLLPNISPLFRHTSRRRRSGNSLRIFNIFCSPLKMHYHLILPFPTFFFVCTFCGFVGITRMCFLYCNRTSTMSVTLLLAVFALCVAVAACAILCPEDFCRSVDCAVAAGENDPPCAANQRLNENGTFCGCCPTCVTQLGNVFLVSLFEDTLIIGIL
jgi:hypothetical protein